MAILPPPSRVQHRVPQGLDPSNPEVALKLPPSLTELSKDELDAIDPHAYSKFMAAMAYEIRAMSYKPSAIIRISSNSSAFRFGNGSSPACRFPILVIG